jgi:hypothetical protein
MIANVMNGPKPPFILWCNTAGRLSHCGRSRSAQHFAILRGQYALKNPHIASQDRIPGFASAKLT